ncbi:hypothetical protein DVS77_28180 [Mycolicibacterium moriokaense]|nr:hypothetical protein DVS77_28180 [Mycolicibacterium moriokaense]
MLDGLVDAVGLPRIHWQVARLNPGASAAELQAQTIEAIRSLVDDGLVEIGYTNAENDFVAEQLAESMQQIQQTYIAHYDEPVRWFQVVWVNLTEKGRDLVLASQEGQRVEKHERERMAANKAADRQHNPSDGLP